MAEATGMTDLAVNFIFSTRIVTLVDNSIFEIISKIAEKRKKLKKEGKDTRIDEDDPLKYATYTNFWLLWIKVIEMKSLI